MPKFLDILLNPSRYDKLNRIVAFGTAIGVGAVALGITLLFVSIIVPALLFLAGAYLLSGLFVASASFVAYHIAKRCNDKKTSSVQSNSVHNDSKLENKNALTPQNKPLQAVKNTSVVSERPKADSGSFCSRLKNFSLFGLKPVAAAPTNEIELSPLPTSSFNKVKKY